MAIKTYPLNDIDYQAEDAELFHCTRTSGVYASGHFPVSVTGTDNNITIGKGIGWLKNTEFSGKVFASKEATTLNAGVPDASLPRVDAVVVRFDANQNETYFTIKQGSTGSTPTTPAVERNEYNYELHLYHIWRRPGATAITPGDITDLRMDANYCGLMADSVTQVDMTAINAQVREFISDWENQIANVTDGKMIESPEYPGCYYRMNRGVKEWLNPPMMEDVEYPTTKRQDGKRVYTKLLKARSQVGSVSLPDIERIVSVFAVAERDWNGEKLMFQLPVDFLPKDSPAIQKMQIYYQGNTIVFQSVIAKGAYNLYITAEYTKPGDEVAYTNVTADGDTVNVETNGDVSAQGDSLNVEMFTTVSTDGGTYIRRLTINGVAYDLAVGQAGSGAPGTAYPGIPGQFYTDLDSGEVYVCMGGSADVGVYIWRTIIPSTLSTSGVRLNHKTGIEFALIKASQGAIVVSNGSKDAVIRGVADPVNANDVANKQYVDSKISSGGVTGSNVTPQMFGALGDGVTDDTAAIQRAFDSLTDGGMVYFPAGTYIVQHADNKTDEDYVAVLVEGKRGLTVVFDNGATVKHNLTTVNRYTMFRFSGCNGLEIRGGVIEGDRDEHPDVTTSYGSKGIHIVNSNKVYIHDMEIRNIFGDCIGVTGTGQQCENVLIDNCTLHESYRNGITIGGVKRGHVRNCHIYNISGADPQAGIDMEAEYGYDNEDITVDNCYIHDCANSAIIFSSNSRDIKVKDCYLDGRVSSAYTSDNIELFNTTITGAINVSNDNILKNCVVGCLGCYDDIDHPNVTVRAYNTIFRGIETSPTIGVFSVQGVANLYFKDCEFHKLQSSTDVTHALFYSHGNDMDRVEVVVDGGIINVLNASEQHKVFATGNYKSFKLNNCQIVAKSTKMDSALVRIDAAEVGMMNCIIDTCAVTTWASGGSVILFGGMVNTLNCHGNIFVTNVAATRVFDLNYFAGSAYITQNTAPMFSRLCAKGNSAVVFEHGNTIIGSVGSTEAV